MQPAQLVAPKEAPLEALLDIHTEDYLHRIHTSSWTIAQARHRGDALSPAVTRLLTSDHTYSHCASWVHTANIEGNAVQVTELPPLVSLPNWLLQWRVVSAWDEASAMK